MDEKAVREAYEDAKNHTRPVHDCLKEACVAAIRKALEGHIEERHVARSGLDLEEQVHQHWESQKELEKRVDKDITGVLTDLNDFIITCGERFTKLEKRVEEHEDGHWIKSLGFKEKE